MIAIQVANRFDFLVNLFLDIWHKACRLVYLVLVSGAASVMVSAMVSEGAAGAELVAAGEAPSFPFTARAMVAARRAAVVTLSVPTAALRVEVLSFWAGGHMVDDDEDEE